MQMAEAIYYLKMKKMNIDNIGDPNKKDLRSRAEIEKSKLSDSERASILNKEQGLKEENERLKDWKESAMNVMPDFQEIAKLLNVPLGESVHDKIIPGIKKQQSRIKELERPTSDAVEEPLYTELFLGETGNTMTVNCFDDDHQLSIVIRDSGKKSIYSMNAWEVKQVIDFLTAHLKSEYESGD